MSRQALESAELAQIFVKECQQRQPTEFSAESTDDKLTSNKHWLEKMLVAKFLLGRSLSETDGKGASVLFNVRATFYRCVLLTQLHRRWMNTVISLVSNLLKRLTKLALS
jgi:hypothetical protein